MSKDFSQETDIEPSIVNSQPHSLDNINVVTNNGVVNAVVKQQIIIQQNQSQTQNIGAIDPSFCNIFVLNGKTFTGGCFSIFKSRINLNGIDLSRATTFPSLFIKANGDYLRCADPNQEFRYGFITAIEDEGNSLKVCCNLRPTVPLLQTKLIDTVVKLKITPINGVDVFDQTGWNVYQLDIKQTLSENGFNMTVYA